MRRRHVLVAVGTLLVGLADPATADVPFVAGGYVLHLRATAVSGALGPADPGIGVSIVDLDKVRGQEVGRCETVGAGVYADDLLRRPGKGDHPASLAYDDEALPVPTGDRDVTPSPNPGAGWGRGPHLLSDPPRAVGYGIVHYADDGPGVRWIAKCDNDSSGHASASNGDLRGIGTAGSTVTAGVDRLGMRYVGTAHAFATDVVTPAGTLRAVSSYVTVTSLPGREPTMTYRIRVAEGSMISVLASATDVPVSQLAEQFNGVALVAGISLVAPTVSTAADGTWTVHAPFLALRADDGSTQLAAVTFAVRL